MSLINLINLSIVVFTFTMALKGALTSAGGIFIETTVGLLLPVSFFSLRSVKASLSSLARIK